MGDVRAERALIVLLRLSMFSTDVPFSYVKKGQGHFLTLPSPFNNGISVLFGCLTSQINSMLGFAMETGYRSK